MASVSASPAWANRSYRVVAFDLWSYYSGHRYDPYIRVQIDFGEHLDEAVLAEALKQLCVTFPLIACRFDTTPPIRPRWAPRREAAREILQVVEAPGRREEDIQRAFACSLDISEGPQLRVFLIRDVQQDSLCLINNHMLCDGAGFKQYLRELARLYSCIAVGLDPSPAPFVSQRGTWPVLKGFTPRDWLRAPSTALEPDAKETEEFRQASGFTFERGPYSLLKSSLSAEDFESAWMAAKTLGFTVNDLFVAAFALAWHRVRGIDRIPLSCTIDMRSFAPPSARMGITNFACKCPCLIQIASDDMMEDVMAKVAEPLKVYKRGLYAVSQFVKWEIFTRRVSFRRVNRALWGTFIPYPLSATNTGVMDEDCVRFGNIPVQSALMTAPAAPSLSFIAALSTFRGALTLSTSIEGNEEAKSFARSVLATITEELMAFGTRHPTTGSAADTNAKAEHGR
jgi:NRPS condensation-like uncharacterized protein